jgi:hypothetical protein
MPKPILQVQVNAGPFGFVAKLAAETSWQEKDDELGPEHGLLAQPSMSLHAWLVVLPVLATDFPTLQGVQFFDVVPVEAE